MKIMGIRSNSNDNQNENGNGGRKNRRISSSESGRHDISNNRGMASESAHLIAAASGAENRESGENTGAGSSSVKRHGIAASRKCE